MAQDRSGWRFSTRELLTMTRESQLDLDHERLRLWHRRGHIPGPQVGHGNQRTYTFAEVVFIYSLTVVGYRIPLLAEAIPFAQSIANQAIATMDLPPEKTPRRVILYSKSGHYDIEDAATPDGKVVSDTAAYGPMLINIDDLGNEIDARATDCLARRV
jgi:hypothetical protein